MLGRRHRHDAEINGEAVVTAARAAGGTPGAAGYSAMVWHLTCRLYPADGDPVDFEQRIGNTLTSDADLMFSPGDTVPVRYDPAHPDKASVDVDQIRTRRKDFRAAADATRLAQAERDQLERRHVPSAATAAEPGVFRLEVSNVIFALGKISVLGRVQDGTVRVGDTLTAAGQTVTVSGIEMFLKAIEEASTGQEIALHLDRLDPSTLFKGDIVSG